MTKPKIGIIADYSEFCPVGKYAQDIASSMSAFEVKLIALKSSELIYGGKNDALFDQHFLSVLREIEACDVTNIHLEFGMYGNSIEAVYDRLSKIVMASKRVLVTVHSMHMDPTFGPFYKSFFEFLSNAARNKPVLVLVNNKKDRASLTLLCKFEKNQTFPILYFFEEKIRELTKVNVFKDPDSFIHKKLHFKLAENDVILGHFGFFQPHKDYATCIKALALLPQNYKLVIAGSERGFENMKKNQSVTEIADLIDKIDAEIADENLKMMNRIVFLNDLDQGQFEAVIASIDFAIVNYLETNISSSSIIAQSLQLNRKVIASRCSTFLNLEEFFPNSFEMIENGNHIQLRQKILTFQSDKLVNLQASNERWKLENLAKIYEDFSRS